MQKMRSLENLKKYVQRGKLLIIDVKSNKIK